MSGLRARFLPRMEIHLSPNRIRLTNLETRDTIERAAGAPFSSDTMMVADLDAFAMLLGAMIGDLEGKRTKLAWPSFAIHSTMTLSQVERRALANMGNAMGFRKVTFAD